MPLNLPTVGGSSGNWGTLVNAALTQLDTTSSGAAQKSANLGDLTNRALARSNIGLGATAVLNAATAPSRIVFAGHSYGALPTGGFTGDVFGSAATDVPGSRDRRRFTQLVGDILGMGGPRTIQRNIASQAAGAGDQRTVLYVAEEESVVEAVAYRPHTSISGNSNANYVQHTAWTPALFTTLAFTQYSWTNGVTTPDAANGGTPVLMLNPFVGTLGATALLPRDASSNLTGPPPILPPNTILGWTQHQVGTGLADPGGIVIVRLGTRVRNVSVGGSTCSGSGVYNGGWATLFALRPLSEPNEVEVRVSSPAAAGATSIPVDPTAATIGGGSIIRFANGTSATTSGTTGPGVTSIPVNALAALVPAGQQGFLDPGQGGHEGQAASSASALCWGVNEAGATSMDPIPFREAIRACAALMSCSYFVLDATASIFQYATGGNFGSWTATGQPAGGQFAGLAKRYFGTCTGTKPSITISVGPAFEGGTIDLFFYAWSGTNGGGTATITVDGAAPPNAPVGGCVIDTTGVSATTNIDSSLVVSTTSGSTTITATTGTFSSPWDLGKLVTGGSIPAGTIITAVTDSTHAVLQSAPGSTATGVALTRKQFVPMVKRLTGLSAGAHTILVQMNTIASTDDTATFIFAGWGWEAQDPSNPVVICNTATISGKATIYPVGNTDANTATLRNALSQVVAGTAPTFGANSVEPALGANVVIADIDTALGSGATSNFGDDGIHPNARGHVKIADTVVKALRSLNAQQLAGR